jgi:hypothetical protein
MSQVGTWCSGVGGTQIEVWDLEPDREPPELHVPFRFTGHRRFDDPGRIDPVGHDPGFVGSLGLPSTATASATAPDRSVVVT